MRLPLALFCLVCALSGSSTNPESQSQDACNCADITVSTDDCWTDVAGFSGLHSPCNIRGFSGSTVIMWQQFNITIASEDTGNTTQANTSICTFDLEAQWQRIINLDFTTHTTNLTQTLIQDGNVYVVQANASLRLYDIQIQPDSDPEYTVTLTVTNCSGRPQTIIAGYFLLEVEPSCTIDFPVPIEPSLTVPFTTDQCPNITANFSGGDKSLFRFVWQDSNNQTVCFTSGGTIEMGRYTCGWTVTNRKECNNTVWLKINESTKSDAGDYTVRARKGDIDGIPAHVLLTFQETKDTDSPSLSTLEKVAIIIAACVFLLILLTVCIAIIVKAVLCYRKRVNPKPLSINDNTVEMKDPSTVKGDVNGGTMPLVYKSMLNPNTLLTRDDLVHVAKMVPHWKRLARHLGLSEPDVVAIEANYQHDYNEQKIKMLLKWLGEQQPTRGHLVFIIEEKMKDPVLAKKIDSVFIALDAKSGKSRLRSQSGF